jgi:hypothetical protein
MKEPHSIKAAADTLQIERRTLQRWVKNGLIRKTGSKICLEHARQVAAHYRSFPRRGPRLGSKPSRRTSDQRARITTYRDYLRANRIAKAIHKLGPDGLLIVAKALKDAFAAKFPADPLAAIERL